MGKKVIRYTEEDIERLVNKILQESGKRMSSGIRFSQDQEKMLEDFKKVREVLWSVEDTSQLKAAVKYINLFINKHDISNKEPEYKYIKKLLDVKKAKFRIK